MQIYYEEEQGCLFDREYLYGKTSPEHSHRAIHPVRTSGSSLKRSLKYVYPMYMYLDLREGSSNLLGGYEWEIRSPWLGEHSMLNTGESPRDAVESSLSEILEDSPHPKYYLSPKACRGILRRAQERGKPLPKRLEYALLAQSGESEADSFRSVADTTIYENHGIDSRHKDAHGVSPTISARAGTGGNNLPLVEDSTTYCITGNAIGRQVQNGGRGLGVCEDVSFTLTTVDRHAVYTRQGSSAFRENDVASTQTARQYKDATDLICDESMPFAYLIRRLTPLECERLQGFPDNWTSMPNASDSARYKALGNSVAIPCVDYILHGAATVLRDMYK